MEVKKFKKLLKEENPLKIRCKYLHNKINLSFDQYKEVCKLAEKERVRVN